jgi:hypothetical protein
MDSIYEEELDCVVDQIPKYRMKILLRNFNEKVEREIMFKPGIGNESLHENNHVKTQPYWPSLGRKNYRMQV